MAKTSIEPILKTANETTSKNPHQCRRSDERSWNAAGHQRMAGSWAIGNFNDDEPLFLTNIRTFDGLIIKQAPQRSTDFGIPSMRPSV
jgi:hypothetical protein